MPCYSVNTVSLDFQAGDLSLLQKAAAVLGLEIRVYGERREVVDRAGNLVATLEKGKATCTQAKVGDRQQAARAVQPGDCWPRRPQLGWQKTMKTENKFLLRKGV